MAQVSERLGKPLMPWQRHVADVALEIDPETGRLAYRTVIVSVPRQSGKTQLGLALMVHRALAAEAFDGPQVIVYTAQTRNDARRKWEDEHVEQLDRSWFKKQRLYSVRKSNGSEAIKWKNGSRHGISSTTEKAGHGETLDMGFIDEAFSLPDARVEQAMRPAMSTRPMAQLWIVSTAGKDDSFFLKDKQRMGRRAVEAGKSSGVAYFEWSAPPGTDVFAADWASFHPAIGHTQSPETLAADVEGMRDNPEEAERAYLNWTKGQGVGQAKIPAETWAASSVGRGEVSMIGPRLLVADGHPDRGKASIAVAGEDAEGRVHGRLTDYFTSSAAPIAAQRKIEEYLDGRGDEIAAVVIDPKGPLGSIIGPLERDRPDLEIVRLSAQDVAQSCGQLNDLAFAGPEMFSHHADPLVEAALESARVRKLGDAWAWDRRTDPDENGDEVDPSPLMALSIAVGMFCRHRDEKPAPAPEPWAFWD